MMSRIRRVSAAAGMAALAACASAGGPPAGPAEPAPSGAAGGPGNWIAVGTAGQPECPSESLLPARPGTLTVAVAGAVRPRDVPYARNAAERLVFRQLYETLIRVDCRGGLHRGLAASWSASDEGRRFTFRLRPDARFWDGTQVTAGDVAWSWRRLSEERERSGPGVGEGAFGSASARPPPVLPDSTRVEDASTLVAFFSGPTPPSAFAEPGLSVLRAGPGSWPLGSGPFRPGDPTGDSVALLLLPAPAPTGGRALSTWRLLTVPPDRDERDLLDAGVDLLVDPDRRAADYAASLPDYEVLPVPRDRVYALAVPGATAAPAEGAEALVALRASLARDAVRGRAVPADPIGWRRAVCDAGAPSGSSAAPGAGTREARGRVAAAAAGLRVRPEGAVASGRRAGPLRLAYPLGDPAARDLADRLVALASGPAGSDSIGAEVQRLLGASPDAAWRSSPLVPEVLTASARGAEDPAYVVSLPRRVLAPCAARGALERALPWLESGGALVPLVDTRPGLFVRHGVTALSVDWDGTPLLSRAGPGSGGGSR